MAASIGVAYRRKVVEKEQHRLVYNCIAQAVASSRSCKHNSVCSRGRRECDTSLHALQLFCSITSLLPDPSLLFTMSVNVVQIVIDTLPGPIFRFRSQSAIYPSSASHWAVLLPIHQHSIVSKQIVCPRLVHHTLPKPCQGAVCREYMLRRAALVDEAGEEMNRLGRGLVLGDVV